MPDDPDLSMDRPTAAELLEIIAETLSETVVPATAAHAQHQARVAANLCRVLGRELAADESPSPALPDPETDLDHESAQSAYDQAIAIVRSKLAVVKPGYDKHDAQAEADVVA